jgi:hypothetical protein
VERFAVRVAGRGAVLEAEDLMREAIMGAISRQLGNAIIKALLLFGRLTDLLRDTESDVRNVITGGCD